MRWPRSSRRRRPSSGTASRGSFTCRRSSWATSSGSRPATRSSPTAALLTSSGLRLDESILTGEARRCARRRATRSGRDRSSSREPGSFEVAAVGAESYAERHRGDGARVPPSALAARALDRPAALRAARRDGAARDDADRRALASRTSPSAMRSRPPSRGWSRSSPKGLILLVSVTYAAAALRMARAGALSQQLNAIESLASVDTICVDKTGHPDRRPRSASSSCSRRRARPRRSSTTALGRFAASSEARNPTLTAIAAALPGDRGAGRRERPVPLPPPLERAARSAASATCSVRRRSSPSASSRRRRCGEPASRPPRRRLRHQRRLASRPIADAGPAAAPDARARRARGGAATGDAGDDRVPARAGRRGRRSLRRRGPDGGLDRRRTPGFRRPGRRSTEHELPASDADLDRLSRSLSVVGRISPEGKRRVVESLRRNGRYVAMVGDGVNDVPALKASRLSIAQGSGTQMAKAVSDVVLVNGDFAAIPAMVAEGRRILRNIQRVTKLFVTKSVFAAFLIVAIGITPDRLSAASPPPHARRRPHGRHPGLLPRARPERRAHGAPTTSCARSDGSPCLPEWRRASG